MFSTSLPTLPCWSQLGRLEKLPARVPTTEQGSGILMEPVILPALENREQAKKVFVLEKRIEFLQQEQSATLRSLHSEIHLLKKENTDLKYELIMLETTAANKGTQTPSFACLYLGPVLRFQCMFTECWQSLLLHPRAYTPILVAGDTSCGV
ncbi:hypothetical protein FKM82_005118 [Ascaphus truei]